MGYSMTQNKATFKINGSNVQKAFNAIKSIKNSICYVDLYDLQKTTNLKSALAKFGWDLKFEKLDQPQITLDDVKSKLHNILAFSKANSLSKEKLEGDLEDLIKNFPKEPSVVGISFMGEGYSDDIELFNILAPFVEAGSFIEMNGEEGETWRWLFDGTSCQEKHPKVEW
jgi:hypothetical protein